MRQNYQADPIGVTLRVEFDIPVKVIFQLLNVPINQTLVRLAKLPKCFQQFFRRPRHGIVTTALSFDLHHEDDVLEKYDSIGKLLPLFLPTGIPINEVPEEGAFEKPLAPLFLISSRLAPDCGDFRHPKPQLRKFVQVKHLCCNLTQMTKYLEHPGA